MKLDELFAKHPRYEANIGFWEFLQTSYDGGKAYEEANLLYQYAFEKADKEGALLYRDRLSQAPLDNQCRTVVHTYSSFVWRRRPMRNLGDLKGSPEAQLLMSDADMLGSSLDEFMRSVQVASHIYGHAWVVMDKGVSSGEATKKEELDKGKRPYLVKYDPPSVWNWEYRRLDNGAYELTYLKTCDEEISREGAVTQIVRIWTSDSIEVYRVSDGRLQSESPDVYPNPLGFIPAVCHYSRSRKHHGVGVSEISDVAKMQQSIYNMLSEMSQSVRNANHNTMVLNPFDDASAGAGGVIVMDESTDPQKKPYLLQSQTFQLQGLIACIKEQSDMINRMTHLSPVRAQRTQQVSGEALKTEFQLLNALLSEISGGLCATERVLLRFFCAWVGSPEKQASVDVAYPSRFELRDTESEIDLLSTAKSFDVNSELFRRAIDKRVAALVLRDDTELDDVLAELDKAVYSPDSVVGFSG